MLFRSPAGQPCPGALAQTHHRELALERLPGPSPLTLLSTVPSGCRRPAHSLELYPILAIQEPRWTDFFLRNLDLGKLLASANPVIWKDRETKELN